MRLRPGQPTTIVLADANESRLAVVTFCLMVLCVVSRVYLLSGSSGLDFDWNNIVSLLFGMGVVAQFDGTQV